MDYDGCVDKTIRDGGTIVILTLFEVGCFCNKKDVYSEMNVASLNATPCSELPFVSIVKLLQNW